MFSHAWGKCPSEVENTRPSPSEKHHARGYPPDSRRVGRQRRRHRSGPSSSGLEREQDLRVGAEAGEEVDLVVPRPGGTEMGHGRVVRLVEHVEGERSGSTDGRRSGRRPAARTPSQPWQESVAEWTATTEVDPDRTRRSAWSAARATTVSRRWGRGRRPAAAESSAVDRERTSVTRLEPEPDHVGQLGHRRGRLVEHAVDSGRPVPVRGHLGDVAGGAPWPRPEPTVARRASRAGARCGAGDGRPARAILTHATRPGGGHGSLDRGDAR